MREEVRIYKQSLEERECRSKKMKALWATPEYRAYNLEASRSASEKRRLRPYEHLYNILKFNSKSRNHPVNLTYEEFIVFTKRNTCYYCGDKILWAVYSTDKIPCRTNLDRLDSSLPYSKNNVVVCCPRCNKARNNLFSPIEFRYMMESLLWRAAKRQLYISKRSYIEQVQLNLWQDDKPVKRELINPRYKRVDNQRQDLP